MKKTPTKLAEAPEAPFARVVIRQRVTKAKPAPASPPAEKRANTFSKSRDTREDRGMRQMKTTHSAQSLPHAR